MRERQYCIYYKAYVGLKNNIGKLQTKLIGKIYAIGSELNVR